MRKFALLCLGLALLLTGCGRLALPAATVDPYAGMVQVESGYGTKIWVREQEGLEPNPLRDPEAYENWEASGWELLAGVDISEVNSLVKRFNESRKMMKQMSGMMKGGRRRGMGFPF